jgi:5-methylthioribose kinase
VTELATLELELGRERHVEAHLRSLGWIEGDEHLIGLARAGDGNMNRTLRAHLSGRSLILKQAVPFVAKYPHIPAPVERLAVEQAFYQAIAAVPALALRTPAVLGVDVPNHLMCLEDLGEAADFTHLYRMPAPGTGRGSEHGGQLAALVYWLWKLHALEPNDAGRFENRAMRSLNHAHIFEIPFDAGNGVELPEALSALQAELASDPDVRRGAESLGRIYLGEAPHRSRAVLLHGDYYPGSWLEHPTRGVMIIDPEFAFIGAPEFDVGVFMAHLLMAGQAQGDIMRLLQNYVRPAGFDYPLAMGFAGMEIIRRLLGVAQLPLSAGTHDRCVWLRSARQMVTGS